LPNEGNNLVLKTNGSNEHWSAVLKINEREKLYRYCNESFNKADCNYPTMENEILAVIRGIEKFLIFFTPKTFSYLN